MAIPQDSRSPVRQQRWIECINLGLQDIPPYGACEVIGTVRLENDRTVLQVQRPSADSLPNVVINGLLTIGVGKYGSCTNDLPAFVLGDVSAATPCGTVADSFTMSDEQTGFLSFGTDAATGTSRVIRTSDSDASIKVYKFTLYEHRGFDGSNGELLACVLNNFELDNTTGCDKPESNPAAESIVRSRHMAVFGSPIIEPINAQFVWFDPGFYPYSRGPLTVEECGEHGGTAGAMGFLWYDPSVAEEDDYDEVCKKRFRVLICDQRSKRFQSVSDGTFPWALSENNPDKGTRTELDRYYPIRPFPKPMGQWPFSQNTMWSDFCDTPPHLLIPGYNVITKVMNGYGAHQDYCGAMGDRGEIEWHEHENKWMLSTTRVRELWAIIDMQYNAEKCSFQRKSMRFRAYTTKLPEHAEWQDMIQLYPATYATGAVRHQLYAANGYSPPVGDDTDICIQESARHTSCFLFTAEGTPTWGATGVEYTRIAGVKDVSISPNAITFSRYYVWQPPCDILDRADVTIEGDDTCPE